MSPGRMICAAALAGILQGQELQLARVESKILGATAALTGEILPFQTVDLRARVRGFVEKVLVDRGTEVRAGQLLAVLSAPEMEAQAAEAGQKAKSAESAAAEARARLQAAESVWKRLREAAATEGAVAASELEQAEQAVAALESALRAAESAAAAARASLEASRKLLGYLQITAPFEGVITDRFCHPGTLAGPDAAPLVRLQQVSRLRVAVAVPEVHVAGIRPGARAEFRVPAHPGRPFAGKVARLARALDPNTRTMAVELEVSNASGELAPGMYAEVSWPVRTPGRALLVPATSVVRTTERMFVIRVRGGRAEWVDVRTGARDAGQIQVFGALAEGDMVVRNATDEIRDGSPVTSAADRPQRP